MNSITQFIVLLLLIAGGANNMELNVNDNDGNNIYLQTIFNKNDQIALKAANSTKHAVELRNKK